MLVIKRVAPKGSERTLIHIRWVIDLGIDIVQLV